MIEKRILLVEGSDDEHVIKALFGARNLPKIDSFIPYGGIEPLLEALPVRLKQSDLDSVGIVVDADTDISARWDAIRNRLESSGFVGVPATPNQLGTVIQSPEHTLLPKVGIWVMPNNSLSGILEDFLAFLVPNSSENSLFIHAVKSVDSIPDGSTIFPPVKRTKALIHTWLAWQEKPGRPLGQSITARFLDHNVEEVDVFIEWIQQVFDLEPI